jgi:hypothetical protein
MTSAEVSAVLGLAVLSSTAFPASHQASPPGRVPQVRQSVPGLKKMGEALLFLFLQVGVDRW